MLDWRFELGVMRPKRKLPIHQPIQRDFRISCRIQRIAAVKELTIIPYSILEETWDKQIQSLRLHLKISIDMDAGEPTSKGTSNQKLDQRPKIKPVFSGSTTA